jgi:hypothetical protein
MTIYQSTKVLPYVYMGIHRETKQFYIGSRTSKHLKLPPEQDILKYKTSSKIVKPIFDEFDWFIIAMFFDRNDAYAFEQELIYENWNNPLILNKSCHHNAVSHFIAPEHNPRSEEVKKSISNKMKGRKLSKETRMKIADSKIGELNYNYGTQLSHAIRLKLSIAKSKNWKIISPDGDEFIINNLYKFCLHKNLHPGHMNSVSSGNRSHHKGWKCIKIE